MKKYISILLLLFAFSVSGQVQFGGKTDVTKWGGSSTSLGQKPKTGSVPVVIASDQDTLNVNVSGISYTTSTSNATTSQLAAGAVWTGTAELVLNQQSTQVSVTCDQPYYLYIEQYRDAGATEFLGREVVVREAGVPYNENILLNGDYFRLVVKNLGIATTTTLEVSCTFGIMPNGPRAPAVNPPVGTDAGLPVRAVPQTIYRTTFAKVLASTWDSDFWARPILGTGMATSQSAGNGVITTGTTANSETILRSRKAFSGSFILRQQTTLSQRIANNNFFVEMVDIIGDGLAITVNSATSVTVTIPNNTFTSENIGQSMYIGAMTGFTGVTSVPGRYAIASVSGNNVNFTVAGFATGSVNTGTCSLFGWNYHQILYTSTTATNCSYDAQRRGWNSGVTTATINTTASPGHMAVMGSEDGVAYLADQLVASSTTIQLATRASRVVNIAEETTPLWVQIRAVNGTTNPASTTTWTVGTVSVENYATQPVALTNAKAQGTGTSQNVSIMGTAITTISGAVPGSGATNSHKAEDAAAASGDIGQNVFMLRNDALTSNASASGDYIVPVTDIYGAQLVKDQQRHKRTYSFASAWGPAASATDIFSIIGSATTTVEVNKITISATKTTDGVVDVYIIKRSTANTGGTSTSATWVPHISTDAAATAVGSIYTANPSALGTNVGAVRIVPLSIPTTTATTTNVYEINFGERGKPIILSGVAQALSINLGGVTVTGGNFKISMEITEY